jgi:hypothetical protein
VAGFNSEKTTLPLRRGAFTSPWRALQPVMEKKKRDLQPTTALLLAFQRRVSSLKTCRRYWLFPSQQLAGLLIQKRALLQIIQALSSKGRVLYFYNVCGQMWASQLFLNPQIP